MRRTLAAGAMGAGAVVSARVLLRPRPHVEARLLDWEEVRRRAHERAGEDGFEAAGAAAIAARCDEMAAGLAPLMAEVCQRPLENFPRFGILDRHGFVDVNIDIARRLLAPVETFRATLPESRASALGRGMMNRYVGVLFGIMAQRVLGQYDPLLSIDPVVDGSSPALYLVEPNLEHFSRAAGAPLEPLRRWLILHELTHAWQFGEHPWLRTHLVGMLEELISSSLAAAAGSDGRSLSGHRRPVPSGRRLPRGLRCVGERPHGAGPAGGGRGSVAVPGQQPVRDPRRPPGARPQRQRAARCGRQLGGCPPAVRGRRAALTSIGE